MQPATCNLKCLFLLQPQRSYSPQKLEIPAGFRDRVKYFSGGIRMAKKPKADSNVVPMVDYWTVDDGTYSIDNFYTKSKDMQGHSTVYHVRLPDYVAGEIGSMIESRKIPDYRTAADLIRDAIVHRLHYLSGRLSSTTLDTIVNRITMESKTAQYQEELDAFRELVNEIRDTCQKAFVEGDHDHLYEYIDQQAQLTESLREPFRSRIISVLNEYAQRLANQKQSE